MSKEKDALYSKPMDEIPEFVFDKKVVAVFDDMIQRSVPGYRMLVSMVSIIAQKHCKANTRVYDLGCSTGANVIAIASALQHSLASSEIIAVDNSQAMLDQAQNNYTTLELLSSVSWRCEDICATDIQRASMVIMNYTLQFIPLANRDVLIKKIAEGMLAGGAMLLSEKICYDSRLLDDEMNDLYHEFKRNNGYSDLEISQKRSALENVLVRETINTHIERLQAAGFSSVTPWFQCFNFVSFLAVK